MGFAPHLRLIALAALACGRAARGLGLVIVAGGAVGELRLARGQLGLVAEFLGGEQALESRLPALVVRPVSTASVRALPRRISSMSRRRNSSHSKRPARCSAIVRPKRRLSHGAGEDQLAVLARRRSGIVDVEALRSVVRALIRRPGVARWRHRAPPSPTFAVPIIASRVTSGASCSSLQPSVARVVAAARGSAPRRCCPRRGPRPRRQIEAHLLQHCARLAHDARAIRRRLVPGRRQAEHRPRVAGAERADDDVVYGRPVFSTTTMCSPCGPPNPSSAIAAVRVGEQAALVLRVSPGPRDHPGAIQRADRLLVVADDLVDLAGSTRPFLGQQRLECLDAQRDRRGR